MAHKKPKAKGHMSGGKKPVHKKGKKSVKHTDAMTNYFKKWDPGQPLRGKAARRELGAATRLEFDPQKRELNRSLAGSDARQGQIDQWYNEYKTHVQQLQGNTQQGYNDAAAQGAAFSQNAGAMDAANRQNIEDAGRRDAAMRGQDYSPAGAIDATNAADARQKLLQAQQARVATQGANQNAYGNATQAAVQHQGIEQHTAEQGRKAMLESDARELAAKEGDFRVDFLRQLREDERKFQVESSAAKVDKYKAKTGRFTAKETGRHNRSTESQNALNEQGRNSRNSQTVGAQNWRNRKDRRARKGLQGQKGRQDAASDARDLNKAKKTGGSGGGKKKGKKI